MTLRVSEIWSGVLDMRTTYSKSQARRCIHCLLVSLAQGQTFVITQKGKAACLLVQVEATGRTV